MNDILLTPQDLAKRWNLEPNTLGQWRWNGRGPKYLKINRSILYRLEDVEEFEKQKVRHSTSQILDEKLKQESGQISYLKVCKS
ncbi:MAG: hypothetical protein BGO76_00345 [Caedibacter sp. 38-128]|nr:helix-turn-helix domain-containing protein [Holosporales bacterium]OJX05033.1 MAG: hypothetical protein BGO76_00345 [Caedibacter sp. 38-128]